jgi:hypothetical protein
MPGDGTNEGGEGANIVGPRNAAREKQDPFTVHPPASDHGTMPNLKWSFADSHIRIRAVRDGSLIENTDAGPLRFLEMFRGNRYANLSLNQWARVDATDIGGGAPADRRGCDFLALSGQGACPAQVARTRTRHPNDPARCAPRKPVPHRNQEGVRPRPVRCLHRDRRRSPDQLLPDAGGHAPRNDVTTIEGLGTPDNMHPMQAAFVEHDGYQCGYCTSGQICSAMAVLDEVKSGIPSHVTYDLDADPQLTNSELRERMSGNICRCGACSNIAEAVAEVAGRHA